MNETSETPEHRHDSDSPDSATPASPPETAAESAPATSHTISRRAAISLSAVGVAVAAGALHFSGVDVSRAARFVRALPGGAEGSATASLAPQFFNPHEWATVRMLVDYIIPRDERSGSATDAKVPEYMDFLLAEEDASENSRIAMQGGLAWIDAESRRRFQQPFVDCTDPQRRQLLDDIAWPAKSAPSLSQGTAFFNRFRDMTASGFFSSEVGWKDLQYMGHVHVAEWQGCPQPALDRLGVSYDVMSTRVAPEQ